ncbi:hypothetical protein FSY75_37865 [Streptomyces sp. TR1341]|nr:hypothetical protein [Streptomyces sp. TR1341]
MCVNKRREPTTAIQVTRRHVRKVNFRSGGGTGRVVRALREIATVIRRVPRSRTPWQGMAVGWNFSQGGNLRGVLFVLLYGSWGRIGPRKPRPASRPRKSAQAGQLLGSRGFGARGPRAVGSE